MIQANNQAVTLESDHLVKDILIISGNLGFITVAIGTVLQDFN